MDRDIEEILKLITDYIRLTYISEIEEAIAECQLENIVALPKEAQLMLAFIPFMPDDSRDILEDIAEVFKYEQVIRQIMPAILPNSNNLEELNLQNIILRLLIYTIIKEID